MVVTEQVPLRPSVFVEKQHNIVELFFMSFGYFKMYLFRTNLITANEFADYYYLKIKL